MLASLPVVVRASSAAALIGASTLVHGVPLLAATLVKAALPFAAVRRACDPLLTGIAESWIAFNGRMIDCFTHTRVIVDGAERLRRRGHYLVLANHQSWVDIPALQKVLNRRIPLLRFFLKRQLFWVPLLGLAWWALDFPFMRRYSREQLARRPELAGRDVEATRRACERFRAIPVAIMNFVEGTRFTAAKHAAQQSPYASLLRPKAGGVAFVLDAMGDALESILDVTIAYPAGRPSLADLFLDRIPTIRIDVRERPLPRELAGGDYRDDPAYRERFQRWMNALWAEKDATLAELLESGPRSA
ncbi:MAG TPA: acyltransferase [Dokdonella sp.]